MGRHQRLLARVRAGKGIANVPFVDLCALLRHLGFAEQQRGSHHIFRRRDVGERINLQAWGADAPPYQVRQVRALILKYDLVLKGEAD
jgi:predicted RNA binding protein YcfA (HicA-like mRNA interferase family)